MTWIARFLPSLGPGAAALLNPWVLMVIALVAAAVWFSGYRSGREVFDSYLKDEAKAGVVVVTKQGQVTERVVTQYLKVKGDTQTVTQTIEKEVVRYAETNPTGLCIDADWRSLHDGAALNTAATAAGNTDGAVRAPSADPRRPGDPDRRSGAGDGDGELLPGASMR